MQLSYIWLVCTSPQIFIMSLVRYLKFAQLFWNSLQLAIVTFLYNESQNLGFLSFKLWVFDWLSSHLTHTSTTIIPLQWAHFLSLLFHNNMQYMSFVVWLISFNITSSRPIYVNSGQYSTGWICHDLFTCFIHWQTLCFFCPFTLGSYFLEDIHTVSSPSLLVSLPSLLVWLQSQANFSLLTVHLISFLSTGATVWS